MTATMSAQVLGPVPESFDRGEVEQFLYREARYADESDYDAWEALWTDDALYWVPANSADTDPLRDAKINRQYLSSIGFT